jgi:hypothetical protein
MMPETAKVEAFDSELKIRLPDVEVNVVVLTSPFKL